MGGGFESRVVRATFRSMVPKAHWPSSFVVKELRGLHRRETAVYRELWTRSTSPPAVRLLGVEATHDADYLYLEEATQQCDWPWRQTVSSIQVCRALAQLHDNEEFQQQCLIQWDYESDLARSAEETLAVALTARDKAGVRHWRRLGDLPLSAHVIMNFHREHPACTPETHCGSVSVEVRPSGSAVNPANRTFSGHPGPYRREHGG